MGLVLSIDVGSTNLKAGVVDERGRILSLAEKPLTLLKPAPGAAEHDPEVLFQALIAASRKATARYASRIDSLVLSTYNMSVMAVDEDLKPLTNIITLLDTRSRETFSSLKKSSDSARLYRTTGCPPIFHYPLAKIVWLRKKYPAIVRKARYFLGVKEYLIARLTGTPMAEPSMASATQLFNIHKLDWDDYALKCAGVKREQMPRLVQADRVADIVPAHRAVLLGIPHGLSLVPGLFDGGAIGVGLGAWSGRNIGVLNMGTTAMLRLVSDKPVLDDPKQCRFSALYLCDGKWFVGGGVNNAGSVAEWMTKTVLGEGMGILTKEAAKVPAGSEGLLMLPFLTGERMPSLRENAAGVVSGFKPYHGRGHFFRAGLEGVAYFLRYLKESVERGRFQVREFRAGGGATSSDLWMRILADVLGKPVSLSAQPQPALVGNAMVVYTALGVYKNLEAAGKRMLKTGKRYRPNPKQARVYTQAFGQFEGKLKKETR